jgi:transposase
MSETKPYPHDMRERAVRMVAEVRPNYESDWAAITAVAARLGIGTAETLRSRDRARVDRQVHPDADRPHERGNARFRPTG